MANDTTEITRGVVTRFYEHFLAGEVAEATALFADPVDWYIPGNETIAPWLGRRTRRSEIEPFFRLLGGSIAPLSAELRHVLVEGETAIAAGEFASRMLATGKVFESTFFAEFTVRGGQIVRYRLLEDSYGLTVAMTE